MLTLSPRLKYIATFFNKDMVVADIGSDHGFLPYYLLENQIVSKAYASDNKKGPFNNLKKTFQGKFQGQIELGLQEGLNKLPSYVNTISMTGMGGDLIIKIIEANKTVLEHIDYFILSPHQHTSLVRKYLYDLGYSIIKEGVVFDEKYYEVLLFKKMPGSLNEAQMYFGPINLIEKSKPFLDMYKAQLNYFNSLLNLPSISEDKKDKINNEINYIKENLSI